MKVACLVYYLPPGTTIPPLTLDPKEVRSAGWVPLGDLTPDVVFGKETSLGYLATGWKQTNKFYLTSPDWVKALGLMNVTFTHVNLPIAERYGTDLKTPFKLWGLTLNFVNELFFR